MNREILLRLYREMYLTRTFQNRLLAAGVNAYTERGEEAISVGSALGIGDSVISCYFRGEGSAFRLKGCIDLKNQMAWWLGRKNSKNIISTTLPSAFTDVEHGVIGTTSSLIGGDMDVAVGVAMAQKKQKSGKAVLFMSGDGATSKGNFHEMLNFSTTFSLPLIIMIRGNKWAMSTPVEKDIHVQDVTKLAEAFGMRTVKIDGNDAGLVYDTVSDMTKWAAENGPVLIYADTYRMSAHSAHDEDEYRSPELKKAWEEKDPILTARKKLIAMSVSAAELDAMEAACREEIEEAYAWAMKQPVITPDEYLSQQTGVINKIYGRDFV